MALPVKSIKGWMVSGTFAGIGALAICVAAPADTFTARPYKDNTLIESTSGDLSNGMGDGIFCGRLGSSGDNRKLRGVMAFNLSAIPAGSTVTSVTVRMWLVQGHGGNQTCSLYRLLNSFGEGESIGNGGTGGVAAPGDATWLHRFYPNTFWNSPGGDFVATASASVIVGNSGNFTWNNTNLIYDVQYWINNPDKNYGWMIRGNEVTTATAKKFVSRNWTDQSESPLLTVVYTPPPPPACPADINDDNVVNVADLLAVIQAWGPCGKGCTADVAPDGGDDVVNVADLLKVITTWGNCP